MSWVDTVRWWAPAEEDGRRCSHLFAADATLSICFVRRRVDMLAMDEASDPPFACRACTKRRDKAREWLRRK